MHHRLTMVVSKSKNESVKKKKQNIMQKHFRTTVTVFSQFPPMSDTYTMRRKVETGTTCKESVMINSEVSLTNSPSDLDSYNHILCIGCPQLHLVPLLGLALFISKAHA